MVPNNLLKVLSALLLLVAAGLIAMEVSDSFREEMLGAFQENDARETAHAGDDDNEDGESSGIALTAADDSDEGVPGSRLVVGAMGAVPAREQIPAISEVPWLESEVNRAFAQAADRACRLLVPDTAVSPPLSRPGTGRRGVIGRVPAVTVGLEVDRDAQAKLPQASRGAIEAYLRDHRLAITPIIYQDESGTPYFGADSRAAFYPVSRPTTTIKAEPMIEDAVSRFRALGLLREGSESTGRTLVMAFRFTQTEKDRISRAERPIEVTELFFLHLTSDSPEKTPRLEVFATSDSRQNLHRLMTQDSIIQQPLPVLSATIRFENFVLMGLYPSNPVVTGVRQRSSGVMSADTVLKLTKYAAEEDRITFERLLDEFALLTGQSTL